MSMTAANAKGPNAEMNVTPLIDVLLVLLIIFMVISPGARGVEALVPQPPDKAMPPQVERSVVVQVLSGSDGQAGLKIYDENVAWENIESRLHTIFAARVERVVFIQGDDNVDFEKVAQVVE